MNDLISRQTAIDFAISGLVRTEDGEKWIRVSQVRDSLKSLPSAKQEITEDGTLIVNVHDASLVGRVLVSDNKNVGGLYYLSESSDKITHCKDCQRWKRILSISDVHKCSILNWLTNPEDYCSFCAKEKRQ